MYEALPYIFIIIIVYIMSDLSDLSETKKILTEINNALND
jgi:hypothetical protein